MKIFLLILAGMGAVSFSLSLLPRRNRRKAQVKRALKSLLPTEALCALCIACYRNWDGILGYAFRHNRGLAGGYLCVGAALLGHILWLTVFLRPFHHGRMDSTPAQGENGVKTARGKRRINSSKTR